MRIIKVKKCKSKSSYRYMRIGYSLHYTLEEMEDLERFTFTYTPSMKDADKKIVEEKWKHKL